MADETWIYSGEGPGGRYTYDEYDIHDMGTIVIVRNRVGYVNFERKTMDDAHRQLDYWGYWQSE